MEDTESTVTKSIQNANLLHNACKVSTIILSVWDRVKGPT